MTTTTLVHNGGRKLFAFIVASILCIHVLVYALKLPHWITGEPVLVQEYYYGKNYMVDISLDIFFIAMYLLVVYFIIFLIRALACALECKYHTSTPESNTTTDIIKCNVAWTYTNAFKLLIVMLTTLGLTLMFKAMFTQNQNATDFFSRWFHAAGWKAALYDMILVALVFVTQEQLFNNIVS